MAVFLGSMCCVHPGCCERVFFLNLRNLHSWSVGPRWRLALPSHLSVTTWKRCRPLSLPFLLLMEWGMCPGAALTSLGPGFTAWPQFAAMCPLLSAQWDLCSYCFPF